MKMQEAIAAGGTVAQAFGRLSDAEAASARLRAAGFPDVRLSEKSGETAAAHVAPADGATETDFAVALQRAGYRADVAQALTADVARGAVLLTVIAGERCAEAAAVLRGETVASRPLGPVEVPTSVVPASAVTGAGSAEPASVPPLEPGDRVIPLRAERLDVTKERSVGEASVHKEVVTENRTVIVPVQREQLVVERDGEPAVRVPLGDRPPQPKA